MDGLNVVPRKKPAQVPFSLDEKYDRYHLPFLFRHDPRYDRYDVRFFRRDQEGEWMDPTAREIWEAMISDEKEPPPPKKPTWPVWMVRLLWLAVGRLRGADEVRSWLEEKGDEVRAWLEELLAGMATASSSLM